MKTQSQRQAQARGAPRSQEHKRREPPVRRSQEAQRVTHRAQRREQRRSKAQRNPLPWRKERPPKAVQEAHAGALKTSVRREEFVHRKAGQRSQTALELELELRALAVKV